MIIVFILLVPKRLYPVIHIVNMDGNSMKVFLVSGDIEFLKSAKDFLEKKTEDLNVDTSGSPEKALKKISRGKYDIVVSTYFTDKEMDCLDFLVKLKRINDDISIIMISREKEEKIAVKALELGAERNIFGTGSKEIQMITLFRAIENELELKQVQRELKESERLYKGMYDSMLVLSKHDDLDYLLATIAYEVKSLLGATDCNIHFYDEDEELLRPIYSNHPKYSEEIMKHPIPLGEGLTGMVAEDGVGRYLNYDDPDHVSIHVPDTDLEEEELESIMVVPLWDYDKLLGAMSVGKLEDTFDDYDMSKLNLFARQVEIALIKARHIKDLKKSRKKLFQEKERIKKIHDIAIKMKSIRSEEELYPMIIDSVREILDFYVCSLDLLEDGEFEVKATMGGVNKKGDRYPVEGVAGETLKMNRSYIIDDVQGSRMAKPKRKNYLSAISVPIGDFGVFQALSKRKNDFSQEDLDITELLMAHVTQTLIRLRNFRKVKESEEKFKALSENSPFAIFVYREKFLYVNDASEELTGYSKMEMLNRHFWEVVHPDHREMVKERGFARLRGEDVAPRYEFKIVKKDGTPRWIYFTGSKINFEGESAGLGTAIDITERKETEEALKETNRKHITLIENLPGIAYRCKNVKNYTMEFLSEACTKLTGYQPDDFVNDKKLAFKDIIHPEDREYVWRSIQEAVEKRESFEIEYRIITDDNEERWIWEQGRAVEFPKDGPEILEGIITDITEQKISEALLKEREEKYRTIFECADDAIFVMKDDIFIDCNVKTLDIFQCSRDDIVDEPPYKFSPPKQPDGRDSKEKALEKINAALSGKPQLFEWVHTTMAGERFYAEVNLNRYKINDELYIMAIVRDISEQKQAEKELREYKDQLEEMVEERTAALRDANIELKAFTHSMSHDLKAPLRAIQGFTRELMKEQKEGLDQDGVECLKRIHKASVRMNTLIEDLLRYSEVSKEKRALTQVSLNEVLKETIQDFEEVIEEKNAIVSIEGKMPVVMGRYSTMVQIFSNLLSNALKFVEDGQSPEIKIYAESSEDVVRIWVQDKGIGIPEERHDEIFHLFERLHGREIYPGTGIGLSIVNKAVEKMEGKVGVESKSGEGSKFWVELVPYR